LERNGALDAIGHMFYPHAAWNPPHVPGRGGGGGEEPGRVAPAPDLEGARRE